MTAPSNKAVNLERLVQLLDAYGGEPARWPDAERSAALRLIETDNEAHKLYSEACELDLALDASELADPTSPQLRARVLEIPIRHERTAGNVVVPRFGWKMMLFGLTPCVLGFLSGTLFTEPAPADLAMDEDEQAWEELAQVVMPLPLADDIDLFDEELP